MTYAIYKKEDRTEIEKVMSHLRKKTDPWSFKRFVGRSVSYLVIAECACLAGSYIGYRKINHDQEFRYKLYSSEYSTLNVIVEGYYKLGEQMNSECSIRQLDQDHWKSQGKAL